ncbi:hypothetical protein FXB40_34375 [Bradyrhizobium rifense]|uniref:Uncharacterized protein n=1 Tax=Bradyrhizobium rifense TaxID=515499 RepID=A0A5D3K4L5_9BRAD|nr:hypothetical protein [Bradyrhizobium rifense]TYL89713.1 hypothetical protein FXB40_34375 [Bradyrhizobium rifense]
MNRIIFLFDKMQLAFYGNLVGHERDFRIEMNAILFPREQFLEFKNGAEQFRDGLSIWKQLRNTDSKDGVLRPVHGSRITFATARQNFVNWLSGRQELVDLTRTALKQ